MKRVIVAIAFCSIAVSCKSEEPTTSTTTTQPDSELYLDFLGSGGSNTASQEPIGACWLTGAHEFVVVGELGADPTFGGYSPDCTVVDPYLDGYWEIQLLPFRTAGADKLAGPTKVLAIMSITEFLFDGAVKGDEYMLSVRESKGELFVMNGIRVETSSIEPADRETHNYTFSTVWSELEQELVEVQTEFATRCTGPLEQGPAGARNMDDNEFATWIRTPMPKSCDDVFVEDSPPPPPETGTVNDNAPDAG